MAHSKLGAPKPKPVGRQVSEPPPTFANGSRLASVLMLSSIRGLDELTPAALAPVRQLTAKNLGCPVELHLIKCARIDNVPFTALVLVEARGALVGVYEAVDYCRAVRCNRVCDAVVRDLLAAFGSFPRISAKLEPLNPFSGSSILPSGTSPDLILGFC